MKRYVAVSAALSMAALLAGCQTDVQRKEEMMAAAGFRVKVADTPAKAQEMRKLPPQKFIMVSNPKGGVTYLYADPTGCNCVYYGGQQVYGAYQRIARAQAIADEQLMAAQMAQDAAWNWGAWGPGWYFY